MSEDDSELYSATQSRMRHSRLTKELTTKYVNEQLLQTKEDKQADSVVERIGRELRKAVADARCDARRDTDEVRKLLREVILGMQHANRPGAADRIDEI